MEFLIMTLVVYGISAIVTMGKIFAPLRDVAEKHSPNFWKYLTSCMQCLPFWVGVFVSFVYGAPLKVENEMLSPYLSMFFTYLFSGAVWSGTTFLIHTLFVRIKGEEWDKFQEKERQGRIRKGMISPNT